MESHSNGEKPGNETVSSNGYKIGKSGDTNINRRSKCASSSITKYVDLISWNLNMLLTN